MPDPMTDEQVKNYRNVLYGILGPYALLMSRDEIVAHRDALQETVNTLLEQPCCQPDTPSPWRSNSHETDSNSTR